MSENLPPWLGSAGAASTGFMAQHKKSEMSYRKKRVLSCFKYITRKQTVLFCSFIG